MRPVKLSITAFGPFRDRTVIDFSLFGDEGLFLICGATGSGKTTIFDALSYALFGVTTNEGDRNASQMRCQWASGDNLTEVELVFQEKGRRYTVIRTPAQQRPKKRGDGHVDQPASATLYLPDGKVLTKVDQINGRIVEIVGMNGSQFSQIVMLAQGRFSRFLNSTSDEKRELFKKIFSTEGYGELQDILQAKANEARDAYRAIGEGQKAIVKTLSLPDSSPWHSRLVEAQKADVLPEDIVDVLEGMRKEAEADSAWRKALALPTNITVSGLDTKIEVLESMRKQKRKYGRHREADSLAGVIIALKDSARARRETQAVRETQERYDEVREDAAAEHSLRMWALWAAASAVALLAMSAVYGMARRRYGRKLDESAKRQAEYEHRMVELGKDKRRAETRMRSAEREARRRVEAQAENIAEGRRLYERLTTGGNTDGWTADDYQRLLEYLRTMNAEAVATLESDYERLSPRIMAFAAMTALGYSDDELMRMFNVGASTLRTMKTRLKKKRKYRNTQKVL